MAQIAASVDGLVPVVKGNGYGFGRVWLAEQAAEFASTVCVGTVHELAGLPAAVDVAVLTPTLSTGAIPPGRSPILTVGRVEHVTALAGWGGRVTIKLASSMRRYGGAVDLIGTARRAGLDVVGVSVHPPLAGTDAEHRAEIESLLAHVDPALEVWVSHLSVQSFAALPTTHRFRLRLGTTLWHGDKQALHLSADVLDVRPVDAATPAGYRQRVVDSPGHLVMIGAGSANGVAPLPDGRSPFHFDRHRLALHEPPHMHTSMAFVGAGDPVPAIGDRVDVQRPLITTYVDEYEWL